MVSASAGVSIGLSCRGAGFSRFKKLAEPRDRLMEKVEQMRRRNKVDFQTGEHLFQRLAYGLDLSVVNRPSCAFQAMRRAKDRIEVARFGFLSGSVFQPDQP